MEISVVDCRCSIPARRKLEIDAGAKREQNNHKVKKLNRLQVCGDWEARAGRAVFLEPSPLLQNAWLVFTHPGIDR